MEERSWLTTQLPMCHRIENSETFQEILLEIKGFSNENNTKYDSI